ncbi:MAG TPA: hypothetical protein VF933_25990 [Streptosporangiaceae bacterium]
MKKAEKQPPLSGERRAVMRVVNQRLPTINKILRGLAPDLRLIHAAKVSEHLAAWPRVRQALEILHWWEEMTSHQRTGGGPATRIPSRARRGSAAPVTTTSWPSKISRRVRR